MRKLILVFVVYLFVVCQLQAQDRRIKFEESRIWKEIMNKAQQEEKLVFLDCYTSWCVPCKQLSDSVFSRNEVADFFNTHFICAHLDIEKDPDGKMVFQQIKGSAVPILVFFDPKTAEVVHQRVGFMDPETLLAEAGKALDPKNSLAAVARRFEQGERDTAILYQYLDLLANADLRVRQAGVVSDYMEGLPDEQFITPEGWSLLKEYIQDPLDKSMKRAMKLRKRFSAVVGREEVEGQLSFILNYAVENIADSPKYNVPFDAGRNEALLSYLGTLDHEDAPEAIARLHAAEYARKNDFAGMLKYMEKAIAGKKFVRYQKRSFIIDNLSRLVVCQDAAIVQQGIAWLDREYASVDHCLYRANLLHVKAELLHYLGKDAEQQAVQQKEDADLRQAILESGGHIMRAFKNYGSGGRIL